MSADAAICPLVSVIMPVYNTGERLRTTINCVLAQTFKDFELLLVDDGSTDGSAEVCDEYQVKDSRVRVFHRKNGGICTARNFALDICRGKYIAFSDHDDAMHPECLEKCVGIFLNTGADMVRFRRMHELHRSRATLKDEPPSFQSKVFEQPISWADYLLVERLTGHGVWAGMYSSALLRRNNIRFREDVRYGYEDHFFLLDCCLSSSKTVLIPDLLYTWIQSEDSSASMRTEPTVTQYHLQSLILWSNMETESMQRLHVSLENSQARKYTYLGYAVWEINRAQMSYRQRRKAYADFQDAISFSTNTVGSKGKTVKDMVKNWCLNHNFIYTYSLLKGIREYVWNIQCRIGEWLG